MNNGSIHDAVIRLDGWVERADWKAYDTFDGLSSPLAPFATLGVPFLKQVWQQGVRRFPFNLRPLLGIKPSMSTKGMGFFTQGYLRLYQTYRNEEYLRKTNYCLEWLRQNRSPGFEGHCWGNHFDYQSRGGNIAKSAPTIVWTGLIAHAFLDAYEALGKEAFFDVAKSSSDFILDELGWLEFDEGILLRYYPSAENLIHNSNMIGASLLARVHSISAEDRYIDVAKEAVRYTMHHQTDDGAWYYGVGPKWAWIDSFHTGYVLEALHHVVRCVGLSEYDAALRKGYQYFVDTFFGDDGTPRYYAQKTLPIDIQCASQAIQTLVNVREYHEDSIAIAEKVAAWTIANMQDESGYFYYRKYPWITNRTPTLHWGQATMLGALAALDQYQVTREERYGEAPANT